jgi:hypothetical protein
LSIALTVYAARTDYLSTGRSLLPSVLTTLIVWLACLLMTNLVSASTTHPSSSATAMNDLTNGFFAPQWVAQAIVATLLFIILVIGLVQSSGVDLGGISRLARTIEIQIGKIKATDQLTVDALTSMRSALIQHSSSLAEQLRKAAGEVHGQLDPIGLASQLDAFGGWVRNTEDGNLIREFKLDKSGLQTALQSIR